MGKVKVLVTNQEGVFGLFLRKLLLWKALVGCGWREGGEDGVQTSRAGRELAEFLETCIGGC